MYQRFLFFGGSKHGERISVQEEETYFSVNLPIGSLNNDSGAGVYPEPEKELYFKQEWRIDDKPEFVFVLSSLVEKTIGQ